MSRAFMIIVLVVSILWWLFPDFFPGPIDDLIAFMTTIISGVTLLASNAKAAQDSLALLTSDSATQSS